MSAYWKKTTKKVLLIKVKEDKSEVKLEQKVEALVLGPLLIHVGNGGLYYLIHEPTGVKVCQLPDKDGLKKVGEYLYCKCSSALARDEQGKMLAMIPNEIGKWVLGCTKSGKYTPPPGEDNDE